MLASLLALPSVARALPTFATRVPNRAMAFSESQGEMRPCITCHNNPDGGLGCVDGSGEEGKVGPCFNPFGLMFRDAPLEGMLSKQWTPALAAADADGDGFTNGQELQDPDGTWLLFTPSPGIEDHVTRPGFAEFSPGEDDGDGDGYCWWGQDLNDDGDCLDDNEQTTDQDCDDDDNAANSAAAEVCTNAVDNDCDGNGTVEDDECADVVDNDGDGYCETGQDTNGDQDCLDDGEPGAVVDCNDSEPTVFPTAAENCFDLLDNDCDELQDLADVLDCNSSEDVDNDGFCPVGVDGNGDGDCLDEDEQPAGVGDCNDSNPAVNPAPAGGEVCTDGFDNDCNGAADFADPVCIPLKDGDGDGFCAQGTDLDFDGNCAGEGEDTGAVDCNDGDADISPGAAENCTDLIDNDCDDLIDVEPLDPDCAGFLDLDGDGYCPEGENQNPGQDNDCVDGSESIGPGDCDDTNPNAFPAQSEICDNGFDDDCDGGEDFLDPFCFHLRDIDGDGYCPMGQDFDGDGGCTAVGENQELMASFLGDCEDLNGNISPVASENCIDGLDNDCDELRDVLPVGGDPDCTSGEDADGDGYCPLGQDLNADGDCQDAGENRKVSDCDDTDTAFGPHLAESGAELCADRLDNDCDGLYDLADPDCADFVDGDGDTFCPVGRDQNFDGSCLDAGEQSIAATDCDDDNPQAYPGRREICDDGADNDCDGLTDALDAQQCDCAADEECDDGDECTVDSCAGNKCSHALAAACQDAGTPEPDASDGADAGTPDTGGMSGGDSNDGEDPEPEPEPPGDAGTQSEDDVAEDVIVPPKLDGCSAAPVSRSPAGVCVLLVAAGLWLRRRRHC